jgi:hypothetical protein
MRIDEIRGTKGEGNALNNHFFTQLSAHWMDPIQELDFPRQAVQQRMHQSLQVSGAKHV